MSTPLTLHHSSTLPSATLFLLAPRVMLPVTLSVAFAGELAANGQCVPRLCQLQELPQV